MRAQRSTGSKGTTVPLAFVIFAATALIFFASLQLYQTAFKAFPASVTTQQQFDDLGNALSTVLTGAILSLPHGGTIEFKETLPQKIAEQDYKMDIDTHSDQIRLYSFKGYYYNYTLSGMSAEVNATVNTTTASGGMSEVKISLRR
jgi:hypothetical protein